MLEHESSKVELELDQLSELKQEASIYFRTLRLSVDEDGASTNVVIEESMTSVKKEVNNRHFVVSKRAPVTATKRFGIGSAILLVCGLAGMVPDIAATSAIIQGIPSWVLISASASGLIGVVAWWRSRGDR